MSSRARMTKRVERYYLSILKNYELTDWLFVFSSRNHCNTKRANLAFGALLFLRNWGSREGVDRNRLQNIVALDPECAYEFAREFPWAKVRKHEMTVIRGGSPELIRNFARNVPGARTEMLLGIAMEREVTRDVLLD